MGRTVWVDTDVEEEKVDKIAYYDVNGYEEGVRIHFDNATIYNKTTGSFIDIYKTDIPKLIKVLQLAERHFNGEKL